MAQKRARESDKSAAGGAKKPRIDKDTDDDEEMFDAPSASGDLGEASDNPASSAAGGQAVRIQLEDLDYEDLEQDLVYDNNGWMHPSYGDQAVTKPSAIPKGPTPKPPPKPKSGEGKPKLTSDEKRKEKKTIKKLFKGVKRLHENWIGVEGSLGAGGQGCARLFVRVDDQQKITERVVIKDSWSKAYWDKEDWWQKGRYRCDPRESITHKLLTLPTPQEWERYIVGYISHSINPTWQTNRVYMEYCESGDLEGLKKAQGQKYQHVLHDSTSIEASAGEGVPEPFVWYYLKQMAIACHRMEQIPLKRYKGNFVVHQDIKPNNIFMTKPDPREFPKYPICKIGDFGSARVTFEGDPSNPLWEDAVTSGYISPELAWEDTFEEKTWELSNATNVWQIARSIVTLMRLADPDRIDYKEQDLDEAYMDNLDDLGPNYSEDLKDCLREMLSTDPDDRPRPQAILDCFYKSEEHWKEMSTAPSCNDPDLWVSLLHWSPGRKNKIGDLLADVPPMPTEKKRKAKIGGLVVPCSDDEDESSSDDEDDSENEEEDADEDEDEDMDEDAEDEEEEDDDEEEEDQEEEEEEEENDYDDDPMEGTSGPSLSSGSDFIPSR